MLALMALGASAEVSSINYSYANDKVAAFGLNTKQTYDVAMLINNPALEGKEVTKIYAYVTAPEGLEDCSVWLTTSLTLESGKNVPNITQVSVTPTDAMYAGYNVGILEATLAEPYTYDGADLYVGYSLTVKALSLDQQKQPLLVCAASNTNGFFLHGSTTPKKWYEYNERTGGIAVMGVQFTGDFPASALAINNLQDASAGANVPYTLRVPVTNFGGNAVKSIDYTYTVDGKTYSNSMSFSTPIVANPASETTFDITCEPLSSLGQYDLTLTIDKVNGVTNESNLASATCKVTVLPFIIESKPLVEEYTGMWCGWCPRGFTGMEMLSEIYGDEVVLICYHAGDRSSRDDLCVTTAMNYPYPDGYPSASINRTSVIDPYYGSSSTNFGINDDVYAATQKIPTAGIRVSNISFDGDYMKVKTEATFTSDNDNADYRIGYVLTANDLSDPSWGQANYFNGQSGYAGTALQEWTTLGGVVYGLVYNDVAVNCQGMSGIARSLPTTIESGEVYPFEFTLQCQNIKNVYNEIIPMDLNKAVINVFIINNKTHGIVNANKLNIGEYLAGVKNVVDSNAEVVTTEYYDLSGRRINNPQNGIFIKADKLSDGNIRTSKVVVK